MDEGAQQRHTGPAVTITLTRYAEPDELVSRAIRHALDQEGVSGEVLFIEQDVDRPLDPTAFTGGILEFRMITRKLGGLSDARNLALDEARHPLVLYLDADAMARPDWASRLCDVLGGGGKVAIAGSRILPGWPAKPPIWAKARVVSDQYSMLDLGKDTLPWHRVVGAAFGLHLGKLGEDMRFDPLLGRREGKLFSGEESEFCARASARGWEIRYVGSAVVTHEVAEERTRLPWIMRRLYYAGLGRANVGGAPSPSRRPGLADWLTLPLTLPPYALGWAKGRLARNRG